MFTPEDFEMPLEKQLRMRVVDKEIEECKDVEVLQESLKQCSCTLMKYQHLLTVVLQKQIKFTKLQSRTTRLISKGR